MRLLLAIPPSRTSNGEWVDTVTLNDGRIRIGRFKESDIAGGMFIALELQEAIAICNALRKEIAGRTP